MLRASGPLKRVWEKMLNDRLNELGPKARLDKATFVDKLCEVWHAGLKSENIISGFTSTGIFPVDRTKYPESRYDVRLLARYERWVSAGKPVELQYDLAVRRVARNTRKIALLGNGLLVFTVADESRSYM